MKTCIHCRTLNDDHRTTCKSCRRPLPSSDDAATSTGNGDGRGFGEIITDAIETVTDAIGDADISLD